MATAIQRPLLLPVLFLAAAAAGVCFLASTAFVQPFTGRNPALRANIRGSQTVSDTGLPSTLRGALPEDAILPAADMASTFQLPGWFAGYVFAVAVAAAVAAGVTVSALFGFNLSTGPRKDGAKEEELPEWANMVDVMQDVLSGRPFDSILLRMRERHGDIFRIVVPVLFGETFVLMGREANQFVFTKQDSNLDQALGGVVGTAVSGKKTMGTKERKATDSGKIFDKASVNFFSNKIALRKASQIFVDSSEEFCDRMEKEIKPNQNVFELLWRYVVQTNADMLYGKGENAATIVCKTIDSINKEGLFSPQVRQAGVDLRSVLDRSYRDRVENPEQYEGEESLFQEFMKLAGTNADSETLAGLQQFMLTLQLAANGNQLVTIRWLMSHVYADKAILAGVRNEVWKKLAEKGEGASIRSMTLDDLVTLPLTNACITEAVRLHSDIPSKLTLRQAEVEMEFGGYKIPKGATLFLYADAVHKDEKYFPEAGSFCPHRYTDPETFAKMQKDREVVAFGHGRKRCTGELHARAQIAALLASFTTRFDMDLVTNEPDNRMPEDHDGPFVFDAANTLQLMNLRPTVAKPGDKVADSATTPSVPVAASMMSSRSEERCPFSKETSAEPGCQV